MADGARHLDQLNLNLLRTFCVIAEAQGITRAAVRLGMRQPSVSQALQRLEEALGCQLVIRDSRRFALTERGAQVFDECRAILQRVERIADLTGPPGGEAGHLRLLMVSNLVSPLIDEAIRLCHHRHPGLTWEIGIDTSQEITRRVASGEPVLGICLLTRRPPGLRCRLLLREAFNVYCGAEHRFFGRETVSLDELQEEPFVAFSCASVAPGLEPMVQLREQLGLGSAVIGTSPHLEEVRRMIACGLGLGLLPVMAARSEVAQGTLWPLRIESRTLGADVFLVSGPEGPPGRGAALFAGVLEELQRLYPELAG